MAIRYEPLDGGMAVAVDDFCGFGADALFLARFASPRPGERVVDLGTGCGILPVLLLRDSAAAHVTGVEIQPAAAALARRSVARSGLDGFGWSPAPGRVSPGGVQPALFPARIRAGKRVARRPPGPA